MWNRRRPNRSEAKAQRFAILLSVLLSAFVFFVANLPSYASDGNQPQWDWRAQVIYLVMTDRFYDGDTANNKAGHAGAYYPSDPRFFHGGDLAGLEQQIPYLKDLGITALWMTPVYKQIGVHKDPSNRKSAGYHGYWADFKIPDDEAIEPKLGTKDDLLQLVQRLQSQGTEIKVIFDMVINHSGYGAAICGQKPEWFHENGDCDIEKDPVNCPLAGLPDFNQEISEVKSYLTNMSVPWVKRFPMNGVRLDTARHVPLNYLGEWVGALRSERPDIFLIAEVFMDGDAESLTKLLPYFNVGFDSAFNFPLRSALVDTIARQGSVDRLAHSVDRTAELLTPERALYMVNMLDNHDLPRFINTPGPGVPETEIVKRYHMALALLFALPGIPQLYYGAEIGMYGGDDPDNRFDMPRWAWAEEDRVHSRDRYRLNPPRFIPDPNETFKVAKRLIELRKASKPLCFGGYTELWRQNGAANPNVYAFIRALDDDFVLVVLNNDPAESPTLRIPVQGNPGVPESVKKRLADGTKLVDLLDLGGPGQLAIDQGSCTVKLPGKTIGAYVAKKP
ncbi:MAG: glycosidase [Desulfomonile tiedjei]|nr:glycosidase [Desulfomonile tiedjei]